MHLPELQAAEACSWKQEVGQGRRAGGVRGFQQISQRAQASTRKEAGGNRHVKSKPTCPSCVCEMKTLPARDSIRQCREENLSGEGWRPE